MVIALIAGLVREARRRARERRLHERLALVPADELARAGIRRTLRGSGLPFIG